MVFLFLSGLIRYSGMEDQFAEEQHALPIIFQPIIYIITAINVQHSKNIVTNANTNIIVILLHGVRFRSAI